MNETLVNLLWHFGEPFATIQRNPHYLPPPAPTSKEWQNPGSTTTTTNVPCVVPHCGKKVSVENSWIVKRPGISIRVSEGFVHTISMRDELILYLSPLPLSFLAPLRRFQLAQHRGRGTLLSQARGQSFTSSPTVSQATDQSTQTQGENSIQLYRWRRECRRRQQRRGKRREDDG